MSIKSPINPNISLQPFLQCKDFTVSRETFSLLLDPESELLLTSPQPNESDLPRYYESEDYISHTDSTKSILDRVYQIAKKYAINKKVKLIKSLLEDKSQNRILDIGCGTGDFLNHCSKKGWSVVGVEPNQNANVIAKKKNVNISIQPSIYDLEPDTKFDIITMWHVLEHVPDLEKYIHYLDKLLKPQGVLIVAVPNYKSYDAKYYKEFWAAYDVPRHLWHFTKKSISLLFNKVDLKVTQVLPMKLDSFYVSLLSEKYKTGKTNFVNAFIIGFRSNLKAINSKEYSSHIYILKK